MKKHYRWLAALISALLLTVAVSTIPNASATPLAADPDGITETCGASPQNVVSWANPSVPYATPGQSFWMHVSWHTTCEGSPYGFLFRRVTIRVPTNGDILQVYWIAHDGSHVTMGCSYNVDNGRMGATCAENTEINGALSGTNPGDMYILTTLFGAPCDVGVQYFTSLRRHYNPYNVIVTNSNWFPYKCG
jgi:hypothetical protein